MTATAHPTSQITAKIHGENHVIAVGPLTPKAKQNALESLQDQGVKLLANEVGAPGMKLQVEWALSAVSSWKKEDGTDVTAANKRAALEEFTKLRDTITSQGEKLDAAWNETLELEVKNY